MPAGADALDVIVRVLAPYLGENMARAAVRGHAEKLGLRPARLADRDVESLLQAVQPGLVVFVGREKTLQLLDEVRDALDPRRGSR
jgi:hypothetical protein